MKEENINYPEIINLPNPKESDWKDIIPRKLYEMKPGAVTLDCNYWELNYSEIKKLILLCENNGFSINLIISNIPKTIVSSSSLGYRSCLSQKSEELNRSINKSTMSQSQNYLETFFHKGTLRSGEHLEFDGDVLLLGDINPGAKISATGDVMVWGRLRGTAHAGKPNNSQAKIVALQLRPLQLRIADQIARGPQEKPEEGLAEQAIIEGEGIVIQPAKTNSFKNFY